VQSTHDAPLVPQDVSAPLVSHMPFPSQQPEGHIEAQSAVPPLELPLLLPLEDPLLLPLLLPLEDPLLLPLPPSTGPSPGPLVAHATERPTADKAKAPAAK
jgi:hypothetical protein